MYLLDTDTANLALRGHPLVTPRVLGTVSTDIWLSAIAAEELLQGSLARINWERSRSRPDVETTSRFFTRMLTDLSSFQLLPYTNPAERVFQSWPAAVRRVGPNGCRIPGVTFEDWSR